MQVPHRIEPEADRASKNCSEERGIRNATLGIADGRIRNVHTSDFVALDELLAKPAVPHLTSRICGRLI